MYIYIHTNIFIYLLLHIHIFSYIYNIYICTNIYVCVYIYIRIHCVRRLSWKTSEIRAFVKPEDKVAEIRSCQCLRKSPRIRAL